MKTKKLKCHPILYVLLITILLGGTNAIFLAFKAPVVKIDAKTDIIPSQEITSVYGANLALNTSSTSSLDYLSNGDRVIKTKTPYFENEVQVYLAAEQAAKHVGEGDALVKDLMAMAWTESRSFNYKAMGDGSKSYGILQIHLGYHPEVTIAQATDPYWAMEWTAERLIAKGWKRDREYAIRSHNGNPTQPQTLPYIQTVNKYLAMN